MTAELVIVAALVLVMIGVSCYGWVTLPSDARVPIHFGVGYNQFVPKPIGLILHPVAGLVLFAVFAANSHHGSAHGAGTAKVIVPILMVVLIAVQIGAITVARRRSAPADMGTHSMEP